MSVGSHWSTTGNVMGGNMGMNSHLDKIASVGGHTIAYVTCGGTIDMGKPLGVAGFAKAGGKMKSDIHYRFDVTSGMILDVQGTMVMGMNMAGGASSKGSMAMTGDIHMKMNLVQ